jgi:hypothetical protein
MPHVRRGVAIEVGVFAHRQDLRHLDIAKLAALVGQGMQQGRRFAGAGGNDDEITVPQMLQRGKRALAFALVLRTDGLRHTAAFQEIDKPL